MNMNKHKNTFIMGRNEYEKEREGNKFCGYNEAKNECWNKYHLQRRTEFLKGYGSITLNALASAEMKERVDGNLRCLGNKYRGKFFWTRFDGRYWRGLIFTVGWYVKRGYAVKVKYTDGYEEWVQLGDWVWAIHVICCDRLDCF